eukprot:7469945-Pyramimonas_sp.AAC.1
MSGSGGKPWPHRERGRRWYSSQLLYPQLRMVGSLARLIGCFRASLGASRVVLERGGGPWVVLDAVETRKANMAEMHVSLAGN